MLRAFSAEGVTADVVRLFCSYLAGSFVFAGLLFVANAAFNNLGHPLLSTVFNWGRATLGTIPFVTIGAHWGPRGVLIGQALGAVAFGVAAVTVAFRVLPRARTSEGATLVRIPPPHARRRHVVVPAGTALVAPARLIRPVTRTPPVSAVTGSPGPPVATPHPWRQYRLPNHGKCPKAKESCAPASAGGRWAIQSS